MSALGPEVNSTVTQSLALFSDRKESKDGGVSDTVNLAICNLKGTYMTLVTGHPGRYDV